GGPGARGDVGAAQGRDLRPVRRLRVGHPVQPAEDPAARPVLHQLPAAPRGPLTRRQHPRRAVPRRSGGPAWRARRRRNIMEEPLPTSTRRKAAVSEEILDTVRTLLPEIAERAVRADESRRIPEETVQELKQAGVFRMLQPKRYGGAESDPARFFAVIREISGACGSTGWVASLMGVHLWQIGLFPEAAQDEVWGADPDALVSSSYAPIGRLTPVEGGYELSGHWRFSSGCDHASWALLGALVLGPQGRPVDVMTVLVPRDDYVIQDVWDVIGLRGTGSNDIIVERAFVPAHRAMRNAELARPSGPGQEVNPGPLYRVPFATLFTTAVTAPLIGMAAGCYRSYIE